MVALISAVFVASLLGSLHCAGMCGGFLLFALGAGETGERARGRRSALQLAYHGGRLTTYTLLGAVAGSIGAALDLGGGMVGVQRTAAVMAGAMMVGFGAAAVLRTQGVRLPKAPVPGLLQRALKRGHRAAFDLPPVWRALVIGLLTTLLPCGWLWAFAITAAGTGSAGWGAVTMAVFWAGTLPVLATLGTGIQMVTGPLGRRLPLVTSLAVVAVGLFTVFGRATAPVMAAGAPSAEGAGVVRSGDGTSLDTAGAVERVKGLDASRMPCCVGHDAE